MTRAVDQWEELLDPVLVQSKLLSASMYITAHEILKNSIIERVRDFYSDQWDEDGSHTGQNYQMAVVSRNSSLLYASLSWLKDIEAINDTDLANFEVLKKTRNNLAHRLHAVVVEGKTSDHIERFVELIALLRKIEVWWIVNVELPTNPDYDSAEIDEEKIVPGPVLMLQMLIEVASGNTDLLNHYRNAVKSTDKEA